MIDGSDIDIANHYSLYKKLAVIPLNHYFNSDDSIITNIGANMTFDVVVATMFPDHPAISSQKIKFIA